MANRRIKPNIQWMRQAFDYYNEKYFEGRLPVPNFTTDCDSNNWGEYTLNARYDRRRRIYGRRDNGTISLTSHYYRDEKDVKNTLLHEMTHEYVNLVLGIWPHDPHGKEFMSKANLINSDGWDIFSENEMKDTDTIDNPNGNDEEAQFNDGENNVPNNSSSLLCIISKPKGTNYKFWAAKGSEEAINNIINTVASWRNPQIKKISFYRCNSRGLNNAPVDTQNLSGVGGMTYEELKRNLASVYGGKPLDYDIADLECITSHNF